MYGLSGLPIRSWAKSDMEKLFETKKHGNRLILKLFIF